MAKVRKISDEVLVRLYRQGHGYVTIARHFGVNYSAVRKRVLKLGIAESGRSTPKKAPGDRGFCGWCEAPLKKGQKRFCSVVCSTSNSGHAKSMAAMRVCPTCGAKHRSKKYCSRGCSGIAQRKSEEQKRETARRAARRNFAAYCARLVDATPSDVDIETLRMIYDNCPDGYEVDHTVPLSRGGLHHPDNLRYLPSALNKKKGNRSACDLPWYEKEAIVPNLCGAPRKHAGYHRFRQQSASALVSGFAL